MWIAKPVHALTHTERVAWAHVLQKLRSQKIDTPLAQTLTWANATQAVSGRAYLVCNFEEEVGGIVFASYSDHSNLSFECINGPFLDWDNPKNGPRQFATFAMAVSKLDSAFSSLTIRPRWLQAQTQSKLKNLPIPLHSMSHASTLQIPVKFTPQEQIEQFSSRLRRTLRKNDTHLMKRSWQPASTPLLEKFVPSMSSFASQKGFTVPPLSWFQGLLQDQDLAAHEGTSFWISSASNLTSVGDPTGASAELLICRMNSIAFYLFGYEQRGQNVRSWLSPSAVAHLQSLSSLAPLNVTTYDLNGYVAQIEANHPYAGVCQFKEQFGGSVIHYDIPEFVIQ